MIIPASLDPCLTTDFSPTSHLGATHNEEAVQWEDFALQDSLRARDDSATLERFAPAWGELLVRAVEEPGLICDAYSRFHGYSLGNRFAALVQCEMRGLEPGPLNSFNGWRKLGYGVKEGEKALTLCMPLKGTLHREKTKDGVAPSQIEGESNGRKPDVEEVEYIRAFVWKPNWFVLSQTVPLNENTPPVPTSALASWDQTNACCPRRRRQRVFARCEEREGHLLGT